MSAYPAFDYNLKNNTLYLTDKVEDEEKKAQTHIFWFLLAFFFFVFIIFASFFVFFDFRPPVSVVVIEAENGITTKVETTRRHPLIHRFQSSSCIDCICQKESGCQPIGCNMDEGSLSCGYFQIKIEYYMDCGEPGKGAGESTETAWKRCADDWNCSVQCINNYINRYRGNCPGRGECEQMARLHNGGPQGCDRPKTDGYWADVQRCCQCN